MSVIHTPRRPELDARTIVFPAAMLGLLGVLFFRLWYFQVVKSAELVERADATREQHIPKMAPRGLIYDRSNNLVAGVKPEIVITGVYNVLMKNEWVIPRLAEMLKTDPRKLKAKVFDARRTPAIPAPIFVGADVAVGTRIAETADELPGIGVDTAPMRYYTDPRSFTHVLGYVRLPNDKDVQRIQALGKEPAEFVGKGGIEQAYEGDLMGEAGAERMEVDAKRRPLRIVGRDNPVPGKQLVLSLDGSLQKYATQMMADKKYVGGVVALDPANGEVLCMVSSPTYDLNAFQAGISQADWTKMENDENHPMVKRPLQSAYSPGSTFKIVTSLAAFEQGQFDTHRPEYCAGGYRIGKHLIKCLGHHGSITFETALAKSCNTFFMTWGARLGEGPIRKAALEMGLGQPTGIDIGGERSGIVPTQEWLEKRFKRPQWFGGDTLNLSIGQGYIAATPLQMANLAAMVGNDGVSYKPHLVHAVRDPNTSWSTQLVTPEVAHQVTASPAFWSEMKKALVGVVDHGTATVAKIPGVEWGGKTGSTEHGQGKKTHGWFIGFAPADHPKIAICVLVEQAGHGGEVAAPIAGAIVKRYLTELHNKAVAKARPAAAISSANSALPSLR